MISQSYNDEYAQLANLEEFKPYLHAAWKDYVFMRGNLAKFQRLTPREKEILSLVASGRTNREISESLHISPHTVRTHRNRVYQKLSIGSFADVSRYARAFRLGSEEKSNP